MQIPANTTSRTTINHRILHVLLLLDVELLLLGKGEEEAGKSKTESSLLVCYLTDIDLKLGGSAGSEVSAQLWSQYLKIDSQRGRKSEKERC